MADNEIKQKIVLSGEKEYSAAIKNAKRDLKTLRSEMQAETAELGKNATEQQKNQVKVKNLQKQIEEQEKIVRACSAALDECKEKYGDNEDAVAKYEQRLNQARTELANMRNNLEDAGEKAGQSNVEVKAFADSIKSLGDAAGAVSDTIGNIFTGMVSTVKTAITAVWGDIVDLAAKSNNWVDLAGFWNTDPTNIQKWAGAVGEVSATLEDLNGIVTKINAADSKKVAELIGISPENYTDDWQYAMAVMTALSEMEHEQRNAAGFEIFGGRQATKAFDLLNDWKTVLEHLDEYDVTKGGIGMTEEEMQTMSEIYDKVNGIASLWSAFKGSFLAGATGKLTLELLGDARGILESLMEFVDADTPQAKEDALAKLTANVESFFTAIGTAIQAASDALKTAGQQMQESENGWVSAVGDVMVGLSNALEWFTKKDNIDLVVKGFETLFAVWTGGKILSAIGTLGSLIANMNIIKASGGVMSLFGFGGKAAANTASTAGSAVAGAAGGGIIAKLGSTLMKAVPWLAGAAVLFENAVKHQGNDDLIDENGNLTEMAKEYGYTRNENGQIETRWNDYKGLTDENGLLLATPGSKGDITAEQRAAAEAFWDAFRSDPENEDVWGGSYDAFEAAFAGMETIFDDIDKKLDDMIQGDYEDDSWRDLENIPDSIFNGYNIGEASSSMNNAADTMKGLPGLMQAAVRSGVSNIKVLLDGEAVGSLIAQYVSETIARDIP